MRPHPPRAICEVPLGSLSGNLAGFFFLGYALCMKKPKKKPEAVPAVEKPPKEKEPVRIGRPPMFLTVEELQKKIDEYFTLKCGRFPVILRDDKTGEILRDEETDQPLLLKGFGGKLIYDFKPPTVTGLALYLGFCDRQSLYDYKKKPENENTDKATAEAFTCTIKKAISFIEETAEGNLMKNEKPVGAIFWLKNHGWKDETTEHHKVEQIKVKRAAAGKGVEEFPQDEEDE